MAVGIRSQSPIHPPKIVAGQLLPVCRSRAVRELAVRSTVRMRIDTAKEEQWGRGLGQLRCRDFLSRGPGEY